MMFSGMSGSAVGRRHGARQGADPGDEEARLRRAVSRGALMAAASVNGPIIPPSIPMVIYGLSVGQGRLDRGAVPRRRRARASCSASSLMVDGLLHLGRAQLPDLRARAAGARSRAVALPALWALMMPVIILVGVTGGIFTVTESATIAVLYALLRRLLRLSRAEARRTSGRSSCRPRSIRRS